MQIGCSYNGSLMTFLVTGEGKFALIVAIGRKGNDLPPHMNRREDEVLYILEGETFVFGRRSQ